MKHRFDVSRSCCFTGGTINLNSGVVLLADWLNYEKGISTNVNVSADFGDTVIGKGQDALGVLIQASGIACRVAATDLPASVSSAVGRFIADSLGSPEPDQDIEIYAVKETGITNIPYASLKGPVDWPLPATPEVGTYPPGTLLETPDISSILNEVTSGGWSGTDRLYIIFRSKTTEAFGTNARAIKRITPTFTLEYTT